MVLLAALTFKGGWTASGAGAVLLVPKGSPAADGWTAGARWTWSSPPSANIPAALSLIKQDPSKATQLQNRFWLIPMKGNQPVDSQKSSHASSWCLGDRPRTPAMSVWELFLHPVEGAEEVEIEFHKNEEKYPGLRNKYANLHLLLFRLPALGLIVLPRCSIRKRTAKRVRTYTSAHRLRFQRMLYGFHYRSLLSFFARRFFLTAFCHISHHPPPPLSLCSIIPMTLS